MCSQLRRLLATWSLGFDGYRRIQQTSRDVARYTADAVAALGPFQLLTDGSELPVFAFALEHSDLPYMVFDVSDRLRNRGWLVPASTFPENRQDLAALRIVIRNGVSRDLANLLVADLRRHVEYLDRLRRRYRRPAAAKGSVTRTERARRERSTGDRARGGSTQALIILMG